jgi:hypothetical protein
MLNISRFGDGDDAVTRFGNRWWGWGISWVSHPDGGSSLLRRYPL